MDAITEPLPLCPLCDEPMPVARVILHFHRSQTYVCPSCRESVTFAEGEDDE
jgi:transposase-like protein